MAAAALLLLAAVPGQGAAQRAAAPTPAPILVVTDAGDPFGSYYGELLRAEGLNEFDIGQDATPAALAGRQAVVFAQQSVTDAEVAALTSWVQAGGDLVAMRPAPQLAGLLGLGSKTGTLANAYLKVDDSAGPGAGITGDTTMQFHDTADLWTLAGATPAATLYSDATTATTSPAVTVHPVGTAGGSAAAFTYDLARSIVYTRQGNPAWAGQERDQDPGETAPDKVIRPDDMFFGPAPTDPEPNWVDFSKIQIPQADEQQRLLANLLTEGSRHSVPLPRFWYLPRGLKAAVVMTGDDHGDSVIHGHTIDRFAELDRQSAPDCSVADWTCLRMTSYAYTTAPISPADVTTYQSKGFELALHLSTNCHNYTTATLANFWSLQLAAFHTQFPTAANPVSNRTHCVTWSDWAGEPKAELANGVRLDANYYYWPAAWVNNQPGLFTGTGFPMRFADTNGTPIDVYQDTTQITDESGLTDYKGFTDTLLDNALGDKGYYAVVTANMHTDNYPDRDADTIVNEALAKNVPVISAKQLLDWLDERNAATFDGVRYGQGKLDFTLTAPKGSTGLQAMIPVDGPYGALLGITRDGADVTTTPRTVKGVDYAVVDGTPGDYEAGYDRTGEPTPTPTPAPTEAPPPAATPAPFAAPAPKATPTPVPAAPRVTVSPARVRATRTGAVTLRVVCAACTSSFRAKLAIRVGTRDVASRTLTLSRKTSRVTLTLSRSTRRTLARKHSLTAAAIITASGRPATRAPIKLLAP